MELRGYITPVVSGVPKQRGYKIRIGCLTPAFSRAQKRAEMLRHPCILGDPQTKGGQNQWLHHPCLLGGPKEGGNATSRWILRVPQTKGDKIRSGHLTPAFSGARRGRKCYVTPAFSGVTNAKCGDKIRNDPQVGTSPTSMHF